jgi:putative membrane protein
MMIIGAVLIGLIIYLLLNQKETNPVDKKLDERDALEIAKIRLAKGEISTEEFEMIKKTIL